MDWQEPLGLFNIHEKGEGLAIGEESVTYAEVTRGRDAWMLDNGQACPNCWLTFPARPMPSTLREFEPYMYMWADGEGERRLARARIKNRACPACAYPIMPEQDTTWVESSTK